MTILNEFVERRRLKRFKVKEGVFAALMPESKKLGQILDLGKGGLSFLYIDTGEAKDESTELDIYVAGHKFYLDRPFRELFFLYDLTRCKKIGPLEMAYCN